MKRNLNSDVPPGEIEGISFRYNDIAFKGSQIDRKYSYGNLKKEFEKNWALEEKKAEIAKKEQKIQKEKEQEQKTKEQKLPSVQQEKQQKDVSTKPKTDQTLTIGGVKLTAEQMQTLRDGGYIFVENILLKSGKKASVYMFFDEQMKQPFYTREKPDSFVKYGKYEMRLMDKMRIDAGFVTRVTVKWYGYGNYAHPYLWKDSKSDPDYKESWGDPRIEQKEKIEKIEKNMENLNRGKRKRM